MQLHIFSFFPHCDREYKWISSWHTWCSQDSSWQCFRKVLSENTQNLMLYLVVKIAKWTQVLISVPIYPSCTIRKLSKVEWLERPFYEQVRFSTTDSVILGLNTMEKLFVQVPGGRFSNAKWCGVRRDFQRLRNQTGEENWAYQTFFPAFENISATSNNDFFC